MRGLAAWSRRLRLQSQVESRLFRSCWKELDWLPSADQARVTHLSLFSLVNTEISAQRCLSSNRERDIGREEVASAYFADDAVGGSTTGRSNGPFEL